MDRLNLLKPLITLKENEFCFVQIFIRRKDNPDLELSVKRLKSYSFYSWEELESQMNRIKEICDINNARAYIRLNKQNSVDVSLRCISEMSDNLRTGNSSKNKGVWDSVSGKLGSKDWWVLDLDEEHLQEIYITGLSLYTTLRDRIIIDLINEYQNRKNTIGKIAIDHMMGKVPEIINFDAKKYIIENPTKSGIHIICKPFDTRILDKYNKELSSKGIQTIQIQKDANTVLYIGNNGK